MAHNIVESGTVPTPHGTLAYRRTNRGTGTPLLVIHGGPGAGSRYLRRLERLDRDVVFYDQLGCGESTQSDDTELWTIDRFADEIRLVRDHLGLDDVHLFAHSAGGWFAIEYLVAGPAGVRSAILANTTASMEQFRAGVAQCVEELDERHRSVIARFAATPWSLDQEYRDALSEFYLRHIVATRDQAIKLLDAQYYSPTYRTMLGPHELAVVGTLANWDRRADLAAMTAPTLVVTSARDHAVPAAARDLCLRLPAGEFVMFDDCGHDPVNEATEDALSVLAKFLDRHE